jgi:hypothetical protein
MTQRKWTDEELRFMRFRWADLSNGQCAKILKRQATCVRKKASRMGLRKSQVYMLSVRAEHGAKVRRAMKRKAKK